jgi:hypothetical protein
MPEHHDTDQNYFGEDYYDDCDNQSYDSEIRNDPYAVAERLHKISEQNPITK